MDPKLVSSFAIVLLALVVTLLSCAEEVRPPFAYLERELRLGPGPGYQLLGLHAAIRNTSSRVLQRLRLSVELFDGDQPFPSAQGYRATSDQVVNLRPQTETELIMNLDGLLYFRPNHVPVARPFQIDRVIFDDGAVWEDRSRTYIYPEEEEES